MYKSCIEPANIVEKCCKTNPEVRCIGTYSNRETWFFSQQSTFKMAARQLPHSPEMSTDQLIQCTVPLQNAGRRSLLMRMSSTKKICTPHVIQSPGPWSGNEPGRARDRVLNLCASKMQVGCTQLDTKPSVTEFTSSTK